METQQNQEFEARPYQISLFEKAVDENSIIYLPTGTGKTFIAVLLVKKMSGPLHLPYLEQGKRTVFIVNTVALVHQQSTFLSRHTGLECKGYTGDMQVDFWSEEQWLDEIVNNQVLVMTAQIFLNLILHGVMSLSKVNLLIFDECHRAVSNHPMRQIMQRFQDCPKNQQPRVLAMSASLLNCNVKRDKIQTTLKDLETTFQSKIITVESRELVSNYATNPGEFVEYYSPQEEFSIMKEIEKIIKNAESVLDYIEIPNFYENIASSAIFKPTTKNTKLKRILSDVTEHINDMGLYGGSKGVLLHLIQLECIKKFADEPQLKAVLDFVTTQLIKIQKLLWQEMFESDTYETIFKYSSPKVLKLVQVLKTFHDNLNSDQRFCCLIFVQRRYTAKVLYHILKKLSSSDRNMKFLKPEFMVGYNNDPYKNAREQLCLTKWNKEVLMKFRTGSTNCIVATDVVDEGVDIPACTLVVRYYEPPDFRAYIQSKGRARHRTSRFIILASDHREYIKKYTEFQETEHILHHILHGESDNRSKPSQDEVDKNLYDYEIAPYVVTQSNGEKSFLTEQSVVSLINLYCTSLLKSKFIMLTPTWVKEDVLDGISLKFRVLLTLPSIAPLRQTISGDIMPSIDLAKKSAAMKACIALCEIGELDEKLLPRKVEDAVKNTEHLFPFMEKEEQQPDSPIPGTTGKKRRHQLEHAKPLYAGFPEENKSLYLHIMEMKPNYSKPDDNRHKVFHDLLESSKTYGILSKNMFPEIPAFPIFMNVGDLQVNMKTNCKVAPLNSTQILSMKTFHTLIFTEVVKATKEFCIFDVERENSFLVVPVKDQQIDWETISQYQEINYIKPKKPIEVRNSDYELSLIYPDYRAGHVYIVTQVCEYLRAESSFPTPDYESYVHYFKKKHDRKIENRTQPMLEVKPISKKINCIKPRNIKAGVSKRKRANLTEDFEEHLVPELCERISFPAVYWLKGTTLPSILHRITQLLVAEDLRTQIIKEVHLNLEPLALNHKWEPLRIQEEIVQSPVLSMNTTLEEEQEYEEIDVDDLAGQDTTILDMDILSEEKNLYSWKADEEPCDLERCADKIQMIDIEAYHQFVAGVTSADQKNLNIVTNKYVSVTKVTVPPLRMLARTNPYGPSPVDILLSLTAKTAADSFNFERVETLGDSYLKFAVSLFLLQEFPTFGEGPLTFLKGKLVGNLNLFYCGKQKNIMGRMNVLEFSPSTNFITPAYAVDRIIKDLLPEIQLSPNVLYELHIPENERFAGQTSERTTIAIQERLLSYPVEQNITLTGIEHFVGTQLVSDKSVSDCVEALIGTYLLHLGVEGALNMLKWFEILPKNLNTNEFLHSTVPSAQLGVGNINELTPWAEKIEERIGYKFRDRAFLLQAFTHPSFTLNQLTGSYQRLEFLGDAVLDFLLTVHIYESCGNLSPGELTDLRSALVNNVTFACLTVRYGLHTALSAYAPKLFDIIDRFVKFQENRNYEVNDELLWVLMEEEECNMAEHVDVPKVLGDIYESVIGAIFLDCGKNLQTVWEIIYCLMKKEIDLFSKNVPKQPIRVIYETQGANPKFSKADKVESTQTVMVTLSISVSGDRKLFHGFGGNQKVSQMCSFQTSYKIFTLQTTIILYCSI